MAKVTFELVEASITDQSFGGRHKRTWARCDLALPAAELRSIAAIIDAVDWIEQAAEQDGYLFIRPTYDIAWISQERAFHQVLSIARKNLSEALHILRNNAPEKSVKPFLLNDSPSSGSKCITKDGDWYAMPKGHYGPGFIVIENGEGPPEGYFLTNDTYDDKKKPLATALLAALFPKLNILTWQRLESYGQVKKVSTFEEFPDHAVASYKMAARLIEKTRSEIHALQWRGRPSVFLNEDDDARNWLLTEMQAGATITRVHRDDAEYDDVDGNFEYILSDDTPLAHTIVKRLINCDAIRPEGYPFNNPNPDEPLPPLVFNPKAKGVIINPRDESVPFQAFQSYCAHRRHGDYKECASRMNNSENCCASHCPLVTQVYSEDVGSYGRDFGDDPAFDFDDWERDLLAYAIHPNTKRSYAWLASGEQAVMTLVNMLIYDTYTMNIPRRLFGPENTRAVKKAIAEGWLTFEEEMPDLGIIARLSDDTIATVNKQIEDRNAMDASRELEKA